MKIPSLIIALSMASPVVFATPADDVLSSCAEADLGSTADANKCYSDLLKTHDTQLNVTYTKLEFCLSHSALLQLQKDQLQWIIAKEKELKDLKTEIDGSMAGPATTARAVRRTLERQQVLNSVYASQCLVQKLDIKKSPAITMGSVQIQKTTISNSEKNCLVETHDVTAGHAGVDQITKKNFRTRFNEGLLNCEFFESGGGALTQTEDVRVVGQVLQYKTNADAYTEGNVIPSGHNGTLLISLKDGRELSHELKSKKSKSIAQCLLQKAYAVAPNRDKEIDVMAEVGLNTSISVSLKQGVPVILLETRRVCHACVDTEFSILLSRRAAQKILSKDLLSHLPMHRIQTRFEGSNALVSKLNSCL